MNTAAIFVLGLLIGWLVEWIIDWIYWRRRLKTIETEHAGCKTRAETDAREKAMLEERIAELEQAALEANTRTAGLKLQADNLEEIKGIGPVIAGMLKKAGITTFAALGALNADELRGLLGNTIQRLSDEEQILARARALAEKHG